ncbi:CobW family GTP-binding protein [Phreatobacter stygius]|uniref:GTP-binding protein n=1 Tax=Phreatobacter stygius TaxID=1940610 RepID=A0A4D7BCL1_9HYPH|nr:GTP-binding protein [Phreatobacter stygius]QCI67116.1 GTP-binding protein [Phreatobacter stygius]
MSIFDRDKSAERIPVCIVTGFLGAGKTTLINRLLGNPGMKGALVIVNEFGAVGLDHLFIESTDTDLVLLSSGCICCTVRGDLEMALRDIAAKRQAGTIAPFDRVLIETTGLADPAPVAALFLNHPMVMHDFRLQAVVTVVDAVNGMRQLDEHAEAMVQAGLSDLLLISKTDIADARDAASLDRRLGQIAPQAKRMVACHGEVAPEIIFAAVPAAPARSLPPPLEAHPGTCADPQCSHPDHGTRHDASIRTICIVHDRPLPWAIVNDWLGLVRSTWGDALLRLKGLVAVTDEPGPLVVHGVHRTFHPPVALDDWPDDDRRTRLVLIVRDVDPGAILASFQAATAEAEAPT